VLQNVLSYVGPGHHLFVALVCKWWKEVYKTLDKKQLKVYKSHGTINSCPANVTLFRSVFESPLQVTHAHDCGLTLNLYQCQKNAGMYADVATLATAHNLGVQYTASIMLHATRSNKLAGLQYMHSQDCELARELLEAAASCGHFEVLRWCHGAGCLWDCIDWTPISAAEGGNIQLMAWLSQQPGMQLYAGVMIRAALHGHTVLC
jgi:hypothetical protein